MSMFTVPAHWAGIKASQQECIEEKDLHEDADDLAPSNGDGHRYGDVSINPHWRDMVTGAHTRPIYFSKIDPQAPRRYHNERSRVYQVYRNIHQEQTVTTHVPVWAAVSFWWMSIWAMSSKAIAGVISIPVVFWIITSLMIGSMQIENMRSEVQQKTQSVIHQNDELSYKAAKLEDGIVRLNRAFTERNAQSADLTEQIHQARLLNRSSAETNERYKKKLYQLQDIIVDQ